MREATEPDTKRTNATNRDPNARVRPSFAASDLFSVLDLMS